MISHAFLVLLSSVGGKTSFLCSKLYPGTAQFLVILFYALVTLSCFLPLKDLNPSLFLPDLPELTYLSLPIFPLVYISVRVFTLIN